jgi:hypothetical protein
LTEKPAYYVTVNTMGMTHIKIKKHLFAQLTLYKSLMNSQVVSESSTKQAVKLSLYTDQSLLNNQGTKFYTG